MQDRYTADVRDFGKYDLLLAITGVRPAALPRLALGVVWYLTDAVMEEGDPAGDGKHVPYLNPNQARRFRPCDPNLFEAMGGIIEDRDRRVAAIRERQVLGPGTTYYEERIHTQIRTVDARIREHLDASYALDAVVYHRGTARAFFIATAPRHAAVVTSRVDALLDGPWSAHFSRRKA